MTHSGVHRTSKITASRGVLACALLGGLAVVCAPGLGWAQSTMTPAATMIDNTATMTYGDGPNTVSVRSNQATLQVQEIVDVSVEVLTPIVDVQADTHDQRVGFRIRNLGNGWQAFDLSVVDLDDDFDPQSCQIMIDWDGDGVYDPAHDRTTSTTPVLAPGAAVVAWVSCSIPPGVRTGALGRFVLRAYPAVLRKGAVVVDTAGMGADGTYLVLGRNLRPRTLFTGGGGTGGGTGGTDDMGNTSPPATFRVGPVSAQLVKTQTVTDTAGGARAMPGSVVTYSLEARFGVGPAIRQAVISDTIPTGSTYVAGSLTLDGASLSDTGHFSGDAIEVGLGDVAAPVSRVVTFKVRINPLGSAS